MMRGMTRSVILMIMASAVLLFSCSEGGNSHAVYYPVDSLVQAQISYLSDTLHGAALHKYVSIGASKDSVVYRPADSVAWANELGPLLQLGLINKPIHSGKYAVEDNLRDPNSNLHVRIYTAREPSLPIAFLRVYYRDTPRQVRKIEGEYRENNALYTSSQILSMELQETHNKTLLTSYSIRGGQKMILADSMELSVNGRIALNSRSANSR